MGQRGDADEAISPNRAPTTTALCSEGGGSTRTTAARATVGTTTVGAVGVSSAPAPAAAVARRATGCSVVVVWPQANANRTQNKTKK